MLVGLLLTYEMDANGKRRLWELERDGAREMEERNK
jgi:hypothetical protein